MSKLETFGKYVLLEKLAMGGMAEVYLGRSIGAGGVGRFVAVKRILPQFSEQPEFVDMFKDEASIAINLQHSNIVTITEFGMEKNQFFIVMDYVNGRNLKQILNKIKQTNTPLGIEHIVYICKEIAAGLDHAHRCLNPATAKPLNIIHRDMSPHNVMLSFEGEIKVVDFGIAKAETQIESTRAGTLKGKFGYMSPEQADAQEVDQRTDIFSLGIIIWELLANDRLFIGKNEIEILRKIKECNIQPLRKLNANIPPELEKIVSKALAKDRNLRYRNAEDLHRELHRFLNLKYPDFSKQDFAKFLKTLFAKEIEDTHKKLLEYAKADFTALMRPKRTAPTPPTDRITGSSPNDSDSVSTQKSITSDRPVANPYGNQRIANQHVRGDGPVSGEGPNGGQNQGQNPYAVRPARVNVIESNEFNDPNKQAEGLRIEGGRRAGTHATGFQGSQYGTYAGTKSRLENSSFHRQSSTYASLIAVLLTIGMIIGGGVWYFMNPEKANDMIVKVMRKLFIDPNSPPLNPKDPVNVTINPSLGDPMTMVAINSNPPGAEILIDNKSLGDLTPATITMREGKEVTLTLRLQGYVPYNEKFTVTQGRSLQINLKADRKAYLDIAVMGNGEISIDGKVIAQHGPVNGVQIPADQTVTVRVFDPVTKASDEVRVSGQENTTRRITLIPRANIRGPRSAR